MGIDTSVRESHREVSGIRDPAPRKLRALKFVISGLLLLIVVSNLSFYNIVLIRDYNKEVICISQGGKECVTGTFPCTYQNVTYVNFSGLNLETIELYPVMFLLNIVLIISALTGISSLFHSVNLISDWECSKLILCWGSIACIISTNMIFYNIIAIRADYVLTMQDMGCYTLTNPNVISTILVYNLVNVGLALFGIICVVVIFASVGYILWKESAIMTDD